MTTMSVRRWVLLAAAVTVLLAPALSSEAGEAFAGCKHPCEPGTKSYAGGSGSSTSGGTTTTSTGNPQEAPYMTQVSPQDGATGVARNTNAKVTFSEAVDPASINTSTLQLRYYDVLCPTRYPDSYNPCYFSMHQITATVSKDPTDTSGRTWVIDPEGLLSANKTYMVRVTAGVKDIDDGLQMSSNKEWNFKTGSY